MQENDQSFSQLRKGLLEFAVLSAVSNQHAYVADIIKRLDGTPFETSEGTLYPLLSRLKREELLSYTWVESEVGPPRKYYGLTAIGEARLGSMHEYWKHLYTSLDKIGGSHA